MRCKLGTVLAGLLLLVVAAPAFAQVETMQVNVPFAFTAGKKVLPAGRYTVTTNDLGTYLLKGQHAGAAVLTDQVNSPAVSHEASLVFVKDGEHYSLAQIWTADPHTGYALMMPAVKPGQLLAQTIVVPATR